MHTKYLLADCNPGGFLRQNFALLDNEEYTHCIPSTQFYVNAVYYFMTRVREVTSMDHLIQVSMAEMNSGKVVVSTLVIIIVLIVVIVSLKKKSLSTNASTTPESEEHILSNASWKPDSPDRVVKEALLQVESSAITEPHPVLPSTVILDPLPTNPSDIKK